MYPSIRKSTASAPVTTAVLPSKRGGEMLLINIKYKKIYHWLEENKLLPETRAGFKKGNSTTDHIFSLYAVIQNYLSKVAKLCSCFISFKRAYDSVQYATLLRALMISGTLCLPNKARMSMYSKSKYSNR